MKRGISLRDLEKAMGEKGEVGPFCFDPETMSWSRTITFKLDKKKRSKKRAAPKSAPSVEPTPVRGASSKKPSPPQTC